MEVIKQRSCTEQVRNKFNKKLRGYLLENIKLQYFTFLSKEFFTSTENLTVRIEFNVFESIGRIFTRLGNGF